MGTRLTGRVVANTRASDPDDPLTAALVAEGARVRSWPTLRFEPPGDPAALAAAAATLPDSDWLVVTSPRAAGAFTAAAGAPPSSVRIAAVGPATASRLKRAGWTPTVIGHGGAEALVRMLSEAAELRGARVLFPAASRARPALERGLRKLGARVHRVEAYRTVSCLPDTERVRADLRTGVDVVTFASPSAVEGLARALEGNLAAALTLVPVAAIGPTTLQALTDAGVTWAGLAPEPTLPGLVRACIALCAPAGPRVPAEHPRSSLVSTLRNGR